ncbi:membrane protein [Bacillus sp. FJAT-27916]|uniref:AEC family transporter n=1 Tax=Bacillus sp. FJAT-27916 TaxID=1679169 RepID=UPI0006712755|nr:AEC family transporter [Bacillus sp. FJAT-27916]KMY45255.1 membrane protein [Bacillus sp. FJAT-27916]
MAFFNVLIPVFAIFILGYIGEKKIGFDPKSISAMSLYIMTPVLVFKTFYTNIVNIDYLYITVFALTLCIALILIIYLISYIRGYSIKEKCGLILGSVFMNNGNYGTPVALLLFGAAGFDYAVILMVIQTIVMATVGIYFAARGSDIGGGFKDTLGVVMRMPIVYGALAGWLFQVTGITIGSSFMTTIDLVGNAAIPTIMLVLGMQLAKISLKNVEREKILYAVMIKLAAAPVIAWGIAFFLPVDALLKQLMVIMAGMPSAANTTMYAIQFNTEPEFVSVCTFVTTVLSLISLPVLFAFVL